MCLFFISHTQYIYNLFFSFSPPFPIKNGDLIQDDIQNLKWGAVLDSLRSRATQTPVMLLKARESGMKKTWNFCFHFCAIILKMISFMWGA